MVPQEHFGLYLLFRSIGSPDLAGLIDYPAALDAMSNVKDVDQFNVGVCAAVAGRYISAALVTSGHVLESHAAIIAMPDDDRIPLDIDHPPARVWYPTGQDAEGRLTWASREWDTQELREYRKTAMTKLKSSGPADSLGAVL